MAFGTFGRKIPCVLQDYRLVQSLLKRAGAVEGEKFRFGETVDDDAMIVISGRSSAGIGGINDDGIAGDTQVVEHRVVNVDRKIHKNIRYALVLLGLAGVDDEEREKE